MEEEVETDKDKEIDDVLWRDAVAVIVPVRVLVTDSDTERLVEGVLVREEEAATLDVKERDTE